jgi:DNA-directed RNA polymerase subunit M/transcription elongation factor TFIIS
MTAHKIKTKELHLCSKCGNVMITRKIAVNNSKEKHFEKILQCIVCRYWVSLE